MPFWSVPYFLKNKTGVCPLFVRSDLIRREQERSSEIEAIRSALIEGEASGEPRHFDATSFKQRMRASLG